MQRDPVCGMEVDEKTACSHCHPGHMAEDFQKRFWISLIATIPVLVFSHHIQSFLKFHLYFPGISLVSLLLSTFIFFYGGKPFLAGMREELKEKQPGMMTLIGLAICVAYIYSGLVVLGLKGEIFFWELVTLIDIMLLGHWIEMKSVTGAGKALNELAKLLPAQAHLISRDGSVREVPLEELKPGDSVLVKPGEKIPADGRVSYGTSEVNEANLTGESRPVAKQAGNQVLAGSLNEKGSLTVEVLKTGRDSYVSRVMNLVQAASESKSRVQDIANRSAFWLTMVAIGAGLITVLAWFLAGKGFAFALERMVTVMVITCPHALGLAIPLVIAVSTAISARNGLLVRNRTAFENAGNLQVIVFDKTGTLTKGEFGVTDVTCIGAWSPEELLAKAASVEANSEHTIADSITKEAKQRNLILYRSEGFVSLPGKGAKAQIQGETVYVGNEEILRAAGVTSEEAVRKMSELAGQGKTAVFVISGTQVQGLIGLADVIRPESKSAVADLKHLGFEVAMITGDNSATARSVAEQLQIDSFYSQVLPDQKSEKIKELQEQGKKVAMIGDGVNDAPALAQADLGVAIGAGTDVAVETADVILIKNDPESVVDVICLSRLTRRKMWQNLAWATGYNVVAIPLAAGVLYNQGILLAPAVGAVIMSLSTIIVALNARLLSYQRPHKTT